jgi:hypothetical protein
MGRSFIIPSLGMAASVLVVISGVATAQWSSYPLKAPLEEQLREFWPDFRRGGMAEWSMAVVLKSDDRFVPRRLYFPPDLALIPVTR